MTNDVIRAVVITGKYAVRASPKEERNKKSNFKASDDEYPH